MVASEKLLSDSIFLSQIMLLTLKVALDNLENNSPLTLSTIYLFWLCSWKAYPYYEMPYFFKKPCPELWEAKSIWLAE